MRHLATPIVLSHLTSFEQLSDIRKHTLFMNKEVARSTILKTTISMFRIRIRKLSSTKPAGQAQEYAA